MTTETVNPVCEFLETLLREMIEHKEDLKINTQTAGEFESVIVHPHIVDYPKLIGKLGVKVNALKLLVKAAGQVQKKNCLLSIPTMDRVETPYIPFREDKDWTFERIRPLVEKTCKAIFFYPATIQTAKTVALTSVTLILQKEEKLTGADVTNYEVALTTIFKAIGKQQGRNEIAFKIIQSK